MRPSPSARARTCRSRAAASARGCPLSIATRPRRKGPRRCRGSASPRHPRTSRRRVRGRTGGTGAAGADRSRATRRSWKLLLGGLGLRGGGRRLLVQADALVELLVARALLHRPEVALFLRGLRHRQQDAVAARTLVDLVAGQRNRLVLATQRRADDDRAVLPRRLPLGLAEIDHVRERLVVVARLDRLGIDRHPHLVVRAQDLPRYPYGTSGGGAH